jgi:hypothetical protein
MWWWIEKMRVQFSAQVSSEVIANTTSNIIENSILRKIFLKEI